MHDQGRKTARPAGAVGAGVGLLLAQATDVAGQTAAGIVAARVLGPRESGEIVFALSAAGMLAVLLLFGTGEVAIRMHSIRAANARAIWGAQIWVLSRGVALAAVVAVGVSLAVPSSASARAALALAMLALAGNGLGSAMNAIVVPRGLALRDLPGVLASRTLLVVSVACLAPAGPVAVMVAHVAAMIVLVAWRANVVRGTLGTLVPVHDPKLRDELWRGGRHVGVGAVLGTVAARVDVLLLRALAGPEATGLYGACYRVLNGLGAISAASSLALFPGLARALGSSGARRALTRFALVPAVLALVALASASMAEPLVVAIYGEAFRAAAPLFAVLLVAGAVQSVDAFLHKALIAGGLERSLPIAQGLSAATNVALNVWLVPRHGALGAAIATLACELMVPLAHAVFHRRLARIAAAA